MNWFVLNRNCLVSSFLSFALCTAMALGGVKLTDNDSELLELLELMDESMRILDAVEDRRTLEAYEKSGSEVVPWTREAVLPRPDNAALLYYQAFLLRPDPNTTIASEIDEVLKGAEPSRQIRMYLGYCRPMIRTAELASQIPQCSWGIWYGSGSEFGNNSLGRQIRRLSSILAVDARTLAADGHSRAALTRCLTMRRIARHVGDDTIIQSLTSRSPDTLGLCTAQHVLGLMPPDVETLTWFRAQLGVTQGAPLSFGKTLQSDFESHLHGMRTNQALLSKIRNELVEQAETEHAKERTRNMTATQLLLRARRAYTTFRDAILKVEDGDVPYNEKCREMQRLADELREEYGNDPAAGRLIFWCAADGVIAEGYGFQVRHEAHVNGIKAAAEIYLVLAKTGKLPEEIPEHLPKDPFTGRDFVYEITDEGFALRCAGEDFRGRRKRLLEFRVRR